MRNAAPLAAAALVVASLFAVQPALAQTTPPDVRDLVGARQDLAKARELAPDDKEVLTESAALEALLAREDPQVNSKGAHLDQAREHLLRAHKLDPKDAATVSKLAEVEAIAKRVAEGVIVGDPTSEKTNIGPVVSKTQFERVEGTFPRASPRAPM